MKKLELVTGASTPSDVPAPPSQLGADGLRLWSRIHGEYQIEDAAGSEMLLQICQAMDRAADCARIIAKDGLLVRAAKGRAMRDHPLAKIELINRTFVVRSLKALGLDLQPVRAIGRPVY